VRLSITLQFDLYVYHSSLGDNDFDRLPRRLDAVETSRNDDLGLKSPLTPIKSGRFAWFFFMLNTIYLLFINNFLLLYT